MGKESIEQGLEKRVIPICLKNVGTISQHGRQVRHDDIALPGVGNSRLKQLIKRKFTKAAVHFSPGGWSSGHHDRIPTAQRHFFIPFGYQPFPRQSSRRPATAIDAMKFPIHPNESKGITSQTITSRFKNSQTNGGGQCRIDSISAMFQHIETGLGGQMLGRTYHAPPTVNDFSARGIRVNTTINIHRTLLLF